MILTKAAKISRQAFHWLVQAPQSTGVNQGLINIACLTGCVLMLCVLMVNLFLAMPRLLVLLNLLGLALYSGLYLFARWRPFKAWIPMALNYGTLLLLHLAWFFNNGLLGPLPLFYPALAVWGAFVLSHRQLVVFLVMVSLSALLNSVMEFALPHWLSPYPHPFSQKLDIALSLGFILLVMSIGLYLFRSIYLQEQRLLRQATLYKSRFLANISHELRTPLNAVLGFNRVLRLKHAGQFSPRQLMYLERIHENGQHLLALVDELLDISKIESGQLVLNCQELSLTELLQEVSRYFETLSQQKGLAFVFEQVNLPETLYTDPLRLRQVLTNLLGNAVKYTPTGTVTLTIQGHERHLLIEVRDSGPGIPLAEQTLIFEPFYRREHPDINGTGLGLAITRQICERLGYALNLSSEPGQGACFSVLIPLADTAVSTA